MIEETKHYFIWEKRTPVKKGLIVEVQENSFHSITPTYSLDDILNVVGFKIGEEGSPVVNSNYNIHRISEKSANRKNRYFQKRGEY